jgi:hypothetical protein
MIWMQKKEISESWKNGAFVKQAKKEDYYVAARYLRHSEGKAS